MTWKYPLFIGSYATLIEKFMLSMQYWFMKKFKVSREYGYSFHLLLVPSVSF